MRRLGLDLIPITIIPPRLQQQPRAVLQMLILHLPGRIPRPVSDDLAQAQIHVHAVRQMLAPFAPDGHLVVQRRDPVFVAGERLFVRVRVETPGSVGFRGEVLVVCVVWAVRGIPGSHELVKGASERVGLGGGVAAWCGGGLKLLRW